MNESEDWKARLADIRELKYLLTKAEERPILEPWAFWVWGGLIWLGTGLNWLFDQFWHWSLNEAFLRLWVPLFIAAGLAEAVAFLSQIRKDQIPWISAPFLKLISGLIGFWLSATVLFLSVLRPDNPLPAIFLLLLAASLFWVGSISFSRIHFVASAALLAGLIFFLGHWVEMSAYLVSGFLCGICFIVSGFLSIKKGKQGNG